MLCPKCETENADEAERCTKCGDKLITANEEKSQQEAIVHQRITGIDLKPKLSKETGVSNGFYIGVLVATVIFPIVGIIMGLTYMRKDHSSAKKAGKNWLIAGVVMIFFLIITVNVM